MSRTVITITIDTEDGATVAVGAPAALPEPPHPATAQRGPAAFTEDHGECPRHHVPFEHKSGVSKAGKEYDFWGCPMKEGDAFCKERPR